MTGGDGGDDSCLTCELQHAFASWQYGTACVMWQCALGILSAGIAHPYEC